MSNRQRQMDGMAQGRIISALRSRARADGRTLFGDARRHRHIGL